MDKILAVGTIGLLLVGITNADYLGSKIAGFLAGDPPSATVLLATFGIACMIAGGMLAALWAKQQAQQRLQF